MTETPEEQSIKPCPFCGGDAEHIRLDEPKDSLNYGGAVICCLRCQVSTPVMFSSKESALGPLLRVWNRRSAEAAGGSRCDTPRVQIPQSGPRT